MIVSVAVPMFVKVIDFGVLVVSTFRVLNFSDVEETDNGVLKKMVT